MLQQRFSQDVIWRVLCPPPLRPDRVRVVSPAEDALVRAGEARRRLHAPVALDPVERVLVAAASSPLHRVSRNCIHHEADPRLKFPIAQILPHSPIPFFTLNQMKFIPGVDKFSFSDASIPEF